MGLITGLATIATVLTVVLVLASVVVAGLTLGVVVPALRAQRSESASPTVTSTRWSPAPRPAH